jgi:hypothetical protein
MVTDNNKKPADAPKKEGDTDMYKGTLRVVTEADVKNDPRVVAAGAVVGQLYDFSNLPYVKDNALEDYAQDVNEKKNDVEEAKENEKAPRYTSEAERREMGIENPEQKPA